MRKFAVALVLGLLFVPFAFARPLTISQEGQWIQVSAKKLAPNTVYALTCEEPGINAGGGYTTSDGRGRVVLQDYVFAAGQTHCWIRTYDSEDVVVLRNGKSTEFDLVTS